MKIAFLGAAQSGKTVYFSAIYHRFRNAISLPPLTERRRREYAESRVEKRMGFGLKISNLALEAKLTANGEKLMHRPITEADWPESTQDLDKAQIKVRFDFASIATTHGDRFTLPERDEDQLRSYHRDIEIYDPTGEALWGVHSESRDIIDQLLTCDVAIAFVPADKLLNTAMEEMDEDEWAGVLHNIAWARMVEIVEEISGGLDNNDTFPLCFVLSKSDCIAASENPLELIDELFYDRLLVQLSCKYPEFLICGCPISVLDPTTGNFKAMNLEWPFLFAVGGTLMRNYQALKSEANAAYEAATAYEAKAEELEALRRRSKWLRFQRWWADGFETAGDNRKRATNETTVAGRKIRYAEEDQRLAKDIWSAIAVEGKELRGMRVLMGGRDIADPRIGVI